MKYALAFMLLVLACIILERCRKGFAYAVRHPEMWKALGWAVVSLALGPIAIIICILVALFLVIT